MRKLIITATTLVVATFAGQATAEDYLTSCVKIAKAAPTITAAYDEVAKRLSEFGNSSESELSPSSKIEMLELKLKKYELENDMVIVDGALKLCLVLIDLDENG